jgi:hypothetical protein
MYGDFGTRWTLLGDSILFPVEIAGSNDGGGEEVQETEPIVCLCLFLRFSLLSCDFRFFLRLHGPGIGQLLNTHK